MARKSNAKQGPISRMQKRNAHRRAGKAFAALTLAALNVLDNKTLTPAQRAIAEQVYELASKLEHHEED